MKPLDERRIDPTQDELVALLDRATRRANARLRNRRVERDKPGWLRFVRRTQRKPEGFQSVKGGRGHATSAVVEVGWWTDRLGRKHWRVLGGRHSDMEYFWREPSLFSAHALWHVYPERLVLRRLGKRDELVAFCGCGAVGTVEALAWVGECCGPCHDRREEGLPPHPGHDLPLILKRPDFYLTEMACTSDGRLITGGSFGEIVLWDLDTGSSQVLLPRSRGTVYHLAVSASGLVAARTALVNRVRVADLNDDPRTWRTITVPLGWINAFAFSPDGTRLALVGERGMMYLDLPAEDGVSVELPVGTEVSKVVFCKDRWTLLVDASEVVRCRIDLRSGAMAELPPLPDGASFERFYEDSVVVSPDGQWLAASGHGPGNTGTYLHHLASGQWWALPTRVAKDFADAIQFTPQGELVFVDGTGALEWWAPATRQLLGALLLPPGACEGHCAFTPDGTRLVTSNSNDDLRIWPWRQLLTG